jgi:hypothetical protein
MDVLTSLFLISIEVAGGLCRFGTRILQANGRWSAITRREFDALSV